CSTPLDAQKTDTVVLRNGDRITGEVKSLDRGKLSYSTDDMGTLAIEWDKVVRITSRHYFEVELESGRRYFGALARAARDSEMVVAVAEFSDTLDLAAIVRIYPIEASFLRRINGYLDVGFTFQRANRVSQFTLASQVDYRTQQWLARLKLSSYFQGQEQVEGTSRNSASLLTQRTLRERWLAWGSGGLEQNEELGLDLRTLLGAGAGRFLVQTNHTVFQVVGGLTYTHEAFSTGTSASNLESLLATELAFFRLDRPKTDLRTALAVYPSLTDLGRVRLELDVRLAYEVLKDFTVSLTLFDDFDSRPPGQDGTTNDFGTTLSLGWTF
ncbi:MAG: DUF481 domain-containing protein, partial [Burkholderiales bacterium]